MSVDPPRAARDWLELRRHADTAARDRGARRLTLELASRCWTDGGRRLVLVDLGAGTGANRRYLGPRLPVRQTWVAVDRDEEHLRPEDHPGARLVRADVAELDGLLAGLDLEPEDRLVLTCSALLDVLTDDDLTVLAGAVTRHRAAALLSLSVNGDVAWAPPHPHDALLREAFDGHQRQDGRTGPGAPARLAALLRAGGREVHEMSTDWVLGPGDAALLDRLVEERVTAACEHRPGRSADLHAWRDLRRAQVRSGQLEVVVGHVDLLVPPPR